MSDTPDTAATVRDALQRLGFAETPVEDSIRVLAGGMSGSVVCRFTLAGRDVVLKRTPPDGRNASLMERATREVQCYRELVDRLPVRVPEMLGSDLDPGRGTLLLLAAYNSAPSPDAWTQADFTEVARDLGRFHASMRDVGLPSWVPLALPLSAAQLRRAANAWRAFAAGDGGRIVTTSLLARIERGIARVPEIDASIDAGPPTLCHGDFHAGNLLRDTGGDWVSADWQEVRVGSGVDDLAFFWQRALAAVEGQEQEPPYDALVDAYWAGLSGAADPRISRETFEWAVAWSELRGWLTAWPWYMGYLSRSQQDRVIAQMVALLNREGMGL